MLARINCADRLDEEAKAMRELYQRLGVTGEITERAIARAKRFALQPAQGTAKRTASAAPSQSSRGKISAKPNG